MKKIILSLAFSGVLMIAVSACNSTKNVSGTSDSTLVDTTRTMPVDTMKPIDTSKKLPPDTTKMPPVH